MQQLPHHYYHTIFQIKAKRCLSRCNTLPPLHCHLYTVFRHQESIVIHTWLNLLVFLPFPKWQCWFAEPVLKFSRQSTHGLAVSQQTSTTHTPPHLHPLKNPGTGEGITQVREAVMQLWTSNHHVHPEEATATSKRAVIIFRTDRGRCEHWVTVDRGVVLHKVALCGSGE